MVGRDVLSSLDKARTQWYHFTAIVVAGMGFFTDAYDFFCISTVTKLLGRLYYFDPAAGKPGTLPPSVSAALNGVAICGALVGHLLFGWLGDRLGRKKAYSFTLICMISSSIASGLSFGSTAKSVMASLCFFRFWLGFGIGGDYPLSATIMSEYANKKTRGGFMAAVFAMQGFGILAGAAIALIISATFHHAYAYPAPQSTTPPQLDFAWRIIVMFGAIPASLTYYWRTKMPETARYTTLIAGNTRQAALDMAKVLEFHPPIELFLLQDQNQSTAYSIFSFQFMRKHGVHLLATASTWFLLDISFYSQNLFQKDFFTAIGWLPSPSSMTALEELYRVSKAQAVMALFSTIPGYWLTVFLIDYMGRFAIQLMGFFMMTIFMLALAVPYYHLREENQIILLVFYAITFFFSTFGPNSTTFIVSAELFPARFRSTCHGISAAAGKAGAILGAFGFLYVAQSSTEGHQDIGCPAGFRIRTSLIILAFCNGLGFLFTFLIPETKGRSLEDLSGENQLG